MINKMRLISTTIRLEWIDLIVSIKNFAKSDREHIEKLSLIFGGITILSNSKKEIGLPRSIKWKTIYDNQNKVDLWNSIVNNSKKEWILFIEEDEEIDFTVIPKQKLLNSKQWIPALLLKATGEQTYIQEYIPRLVPKSDKLVFSGENMPDATPYMLKNNIEFIYYNAIKINKISNKDKDIDLNHEVASKNIGSKIFLEIGNQYFKDKKYTAAAAQFRNLIKNENLLYSDYLGTLNALASCYVESFKWDKAIKVVKKSLSTEAMQFMPYLILYRIFELNKQWDESLHALEDYARILDESYSKASFDKYMSMDAALLKLGKLALKSGKRKKALYYYDMYYSTKRGNIDEAVIDRLFMLSVEMQNYRKSVHYFNHIFNGYSKRVLAEEEQDKMHEYLSMFMINKWYEFPNNVYQELYRLDNDNKEYKRKLIVTLSKTNQVEKAKTFIGNFM